MSVAIPETLELATMLMFLSSWGQGPGKRNFAVDTAYSRAVEGRFGPRRDHPVFEAIETIELDDFNAFVGLRDNSVFYAFADEGLAHVSRHRNWWNETSSPNHFGAFLSDIESFAAESGFRDFYRSNEGFYRQQIDEFEQLVDVVDIVDWLEGHYPLRYDSVEVFFSPLARGNHTASSKRDHRNELRVVVSGPVLARGSSLAGGGFLVLRQTFTEIDHGYISPHSYARKDEIEAAMSRPDLWNSQGGFYRGSLSTFDEYMTWGAMLLYVSERYDPDHAELARRDTVEYMRDVRGFVDFEAFYEELCRLYNRAPDRGSLADFYPSILDWLARRQLELAATPGPA